MIVCIFAVHVCMCKLSGVVLVSERLKGRLFLWQQLVAIWYTTCVAAMLPGILCRSVTLVLRCREDIVVYVVHR